MPHRTLKRLETMLSQMVAEYLRGDMQAAVSHYDYPLAMHTPEGLVVMRRPEDMVAYYRAIAEIRREERLGGITADILAMDLPRHDRFRAWVRYDHRDGSGESSRQSERILYCRDHDRRTTIEMVQLVTAAFSLLARWPGVISKAR